MEYYGARRPQPAQRKKKRRKKHSRTLLFTAVLGGLFTVALLIYLLFFSDRERTVSMDPTPISASMTHLNTGRGLLYQTDGQIHYFDWIDAKKNYTYGTASADIRMTGSRSMSAVYTDSSLQVVGQPSPMAFTGTIETVECGSEHLAVLRRDSEGGESVLVLTRDGQQIDQILPDDQYVEDFGFYDINGERLWVQLLSVAAGQPTTTITTYDLTRASKTGVIQVQNQLIDEISITQNSLFIAGTNQIFRYTHDGNKEAYRVTVYGYRVLDFSSASSSPTFLLTPRGGDIHAVKLLQLAEDTEAAAVDTYLQLPTEGVAGFLMDGSLIVVSRERMYTYSLKGKLTETALFELPVDNAYKLSETMLLLESGGQYYTASIN